MSLITAVACGSSRSTTTTPAAPPATATATLTQIAPPTATGNPPTAPETTTNPGAPTTGGAPPENARIPATFTIVRGGGLNPPTISAPAHIAVQVTVATGGGRSYRVLLRTPQPRSLVVPAHGHATVLVRGLNPGRYPLEVDGAPRGALVIGVAPGP